MVRRIDANVKAVYWSEGGHYLVIAGDSTFYLLAFDRDAVEAAIDSGEASPPPPSAKTSDSSARRRCGPERLRVLAAAEPAGRA